MLDPNTAKILDALMDYHLPSPVSWWPPAPGWWLLAMFGILLIGTSLGLWLRRRQCRAAARLAQAELATLRTALATSGDTKRFIQALSRLLRRFALSKFPQHTAAGLTGSNWLQFLDTHGGQGRFQTQLGRSLIETPYTNATNTISVTAALELATLVEDWIRSNRSAPRSLCRP